MQRVEGWKNARGLSKGAWQRTQRLWNKLSDACVSESSPETNVMVFQMFDTSQSDCSIMLNRYRGTYVGTRNGASVTVRSQRNTNQKYLFWPHSAILSWRVRLTFQTWGADRQLKKWRLCQQTEIRPHPSHNMWSSTKSSIMTVGVKLPSSQQEMMANSKGNNRTHS